MIYIVLLVTFSFAGFLVGFGDAGRGSSSQLVSVVGGLVWLAGLIYAFYSEGIGFGLGALLVSFVVAAITMNVGKAVVASLRNK